MIKLTTKHGTVQWINPVHVTDINHDGDGACVYRINDVNGDYPPLTVKESPEEVVRKIMDHKLAIQLHLANGDDGQIARKTRLFLESLAGLEQTP